ncbi:MAG: hypothetical protein JST89_18040 [Cyanobacteria bacterium SZAS-4]|nr:hypothetical protein [Cyanobacteria bacterium SZAS-4]
MFYQLLYLTGVFAVVLGLLHFTFPDRFGFMVSLPLEGESPPPFRLMFYSYDMKRSDLRGIIYVMNHCASYTIFLTGIFDLCCASWIGTGPGKLGSIAVAGFWLVRAASQTYLGRRRGDWLVMAFFTAIGILHIVVAI